MTDRLRDWDWDNRHHDQGIATNADEVEWDALLYGSAACDEGVRDDRIAGSLDDYRTAGIDQESWADDDATTEDAVGEIIHELDRRHKCLGNLYPFRRDGASLHYLPENTNSIYEFCLAICNAPSISASPWNKFPTCFERLSGHVIACYFGKDTAWRRTGWPPESDRPTRFRALIEDLANELFDEMQWGPDPHLSSNPGHLMAKDETIDVLLWRTMPDKRIGSMFLAVQCACGATDWMGKRGDLKISKWRQWAKPCCPVGPLRCISIPRHIRNLLLLKETCNEAGLTFDRMRLAIYFKQIDNKIILKEIADLTLKLKNHFLLK